jgi:hypothetical protein
MMIHGEGGMTFRNSIRDSQQKERQIESGFHTSIVSEHVAMTFSHRLLGSIQDSILVQSQESQPRIKRTQHAAPHYILRLPRS